MIKKIIRLLIVTAFMLMAVANLAAPTMASQNDGMKKPPPPKTWHGWGWHKWGDKETVRVWIAHVRSGPSTKFCVVSHLKFGTKVHVNFQWGGWSNIGKGRWIASWLLS